MFEEFGLVARGVIFGEGEIVLQPVAAFGGLRSGDLPVESEGEVACAEHRRQHVLRSLFAEHQQIAPRAAAHGTEVDDVVRAFRVAQIRREKVFDGVQRRNVRGGFAVGRGETQVERGDRDSVLRVAPREVESGEQIEVVYRKAGYFFHGISFFDIIASYARTGKRAPPPGAKSSPPFRRAGGRGNIPSRGAEMGLELGRKNMYNDYTALRREAKIEEKL